MTNYGGQICHIKYCSFKTWLKYFLNLYKYRFSIISVFISGTPIQYFFYKPDQDFNHFHYVYNLIRNCKSRVEHIHLIKEQKNNLMSKDVFIKIGIAGNFHEDNLHLISGGTCTVFVNT